MKKQQIFEDVVLICKRVFHDEQVNITESTNANDIKNWDSMTNLFLIDSLEKEFGMKFSINEIMDAQNVGDLCKIIEVKKEP